MDAEGEAKSGSFEAKYGSFEAERLLLCRRADAPV
jgi:hypothetical protein